MARLHELPGISQPRAACEPHLSPPKVQPLAFWLQLPLASEGRSPRAQQGCPDWPTPPGWLRQPPAPHFKVTRPRDACAVGSEAKLIPTTGPDLGPPGPQESTASCRRPPSRRRPLSRTPPGLPVGSKRLRGQGVSRITPSSRPVLPLFPPGLNPQGPQPSRRPPLCLHGLVTRGIQLSQLLRPRVPRSLRNAAPVQITPEHSYLPPCAFEPRLGGVPLECARPEVRAPV